MRRLRNHIGLQRDSDETDAGSLFLYRVLIVAGVTVVTVLALLLAWSGGNVFLLIFAGILLAVFLRGLADWLVRPIVVTSFYRKISDAPQLNIFAEEPGRTGR
ncbi:MAG TPA: hypothetical protein VNQ79_20130 [Blastocatellia bacterium]|nr:hypothetical protein [Blastocatellia bacterium]